MRIQVITMILVPGDGCSREVAPGAIIDVTDAEAKKLIGSGAAKEAKDAKAVSSKEELQKLHDAHTKKMAEVEKARLAGIRAANS